MTERRPAVTPTPLAPDTPGWDIAGAAAALSAPPEGRTDVVLGQGVVFRLGTAPPVDLELDERARTVRLTGGEIEVHSAPQRRFVSVAASGEVNLFLAPPATMPQKPADDAEQAIVPPPPPRPPATILRPQNGHSSPVCRNRRPARNGSASAAASAAIPTFARPATAS